MSTYTEQAQKFLDDTSTALTKTSLGYKNQSEVWGQKDSNLITCEYSVTLTRGKRSATFPYFCSHFDAKAMQGGKREKAKAFHDGFAYNFLACMSLDYSADFKEFCSNFGYEEDSRRAYKAWIGTLEQNAKLRSMFSDAELELLAEIN
jgi:hypothetical protein